MHNPDSRLGIFMDIAKKNDVVVHKEEANKLIIASDDYTDLEFIEAAENFCKLRAKKNCFAAFCFFLYDKLKKGILSPQQVINKARIKYHHEHPEEPQPNPYDKFKAEKSCALPNPDDMEYNALLRVIKAYDNNKPHTISFSESTVAKKWWEQLRKAKYYVTGIKTSQEGEKIIIKKIRPKSS